MKKDNVGAENNKGALDISPCSHIVLFRIMDLAGVVAGIHRKGLHKRIKVVGLH